MKYRNKRNGQVIDIPSELHGGDWEPLDAAPAGHVPDGAATSAATPEQGGRAAGQKAEKPAGKAAARQKKAPAKAASDTEFATIMPKKTVKKGTK